MTAPLYVWYRGAFVAIRINADTQEEKRSLYIIKTEGKGWKTTEIKRKKYRKIAPTEEKIPRRGEKISVFACRGGGMSRCARISYAEAEGRKPPGV